MFLSQSLSPWLTPRTQLPIAPHMNCLNDPISRLKGEVNFCDYVVTPLWSALVEVLPEMQFGLDQLHANRDAWAIEAEKMKTQGNSRSNAWTKSLPAKVLKANLASVRKKIAARKAAEAAAAKGK